MNHIPNNTVITSKASFLKLLKRVEEGSVFFPGFPNQGGESTRVELPSASDWGHPLSFSSEKGSEKLKAIEAGEKLASAAGGKTGKDSDSLWLLKPSKGLGGKGIELAWGRDLKARLFPTSANAGAEISKDDVAEKPNKQPPPAEGWVIQHYVHPPLLLAGRKFDVRVYCLIARTEPALWFFHPGYSEIAVLTRSLLLRLRITTSSINCE